MNEFVEVLQEGSERVCGTALPIEIVLAILFRWGGMVSPTTLALRGCKELRNMVAHNMERDTGYSCFCAVPLGGSVRVKYDSDAAKSVWELLEEDDSGPVEERRTRLVTSHMVLQRNPTGQRNEWNCGECGTYWLWYRLLRARNPSLLPHISDFWVERMMRESSGEILLSIYPRRYDVMGHWRVLIETLQGEPVKTEFTTQAEAWEMYLRADRGEIM
jgi:hypothetical protein